MQHKKPRAHHSFSSPHLQQFQEAVDYLNRNQIAEAIARLSKLSKKKAVIPGVPAWQVDLLLAQCFCRTGQYDKAVDVLCIGMVRHPYPKQECLNLFLSLTNEGYLGNDDSKMRAVLLHLLETAYLDPYQLFFQSASLIKRNLPFHTPSSTNRHDDRQTTKLVTAMANDKLVTTLMRKVLLADPELELLLLRVRHFLCKQVVQMKERWPRRHRLLAQAIAEHSWHNQYAWADSSEEKEIIATCQKDLTQKIHHGILRGGPEDPMDRDQLTAYLMYQPLWQLPHWEKLIDQLPTGLAVEFKAYRREQALAGTIPAITPIGGKVSKRVQAQYESAPYPRWTTVPKNNPQTVAAYLRESHPQAIPHPFLEKEVDVLIAGCGTGIEAFSMANAFRIRKMLAVDLSKASLAYATRMLEDTTPAPPISFCQGDLLELDTLNQQFHVIASSGVLHHLENPLQGWRILTHCLKPGGIMFISLYSKLAGRHILRAKQSVAERKLEPDPEILRNFRFELISDSNHSLYPLTYWRDFYNLSMLRDMVFHVQEQRYDLDEIAGMIKTLRLRFLGFQGLDNQTRQRYLQQFSEDRTLTSLKTWQRFEQDNPDTFVEMYHLVLQKPA